MFGLLRRAPRPFEAPAEGGFAYEVAARTVYGDNYLRDVGDPSVGERVCVILEWDGVDQQEVRGEVVHVVDENRVGVHLEWEDRKRQYAGVLVRARADLAASSASRKLGVWRLAALRRPTDSGADSESGMKETRTLVVART
jgi:hypothetical protein